MYLKNLTLKGFKSFAQPTTFAFEQGVTCVVGPNGSGKSNVVDALAWVMGEQGAKTLRGGKMEDVIFAGTATKGPLGRAEVILTIDNSDGALPIEYTEVTISRTLFRNGGSEYAINGSGCRLLDVQELLSDSGLGREMHVIVGQGQLDAVLHASPEERRGFIEEAAGILKHRRRKEKTLRKLDAMQVNLTRLGDLAGEIRRQLKPLGHQAEIAREAQEIAAVVRDARARILADDVVNVRATMTAQSKRGSERKTERIVLQEQLDQARLRASRLEQAQIGDAVDIARRTAFGLESVQERLRNVFSLANQRLALLGQQAEDVPAPSVTPQSVQDARDEAERLREQIVLAETAWLTAQQATAAARTMLDSSDEHLSQQSDLVSRHDLELSKLEGQLDAAGSRSAAVRGEVLRQQNALDAALARRDAAQVAWDAAQRDTADEFSADTDLDAAYDTAQAEVSDAEAEIDLLREALHGHEREREALTARVSALSSALDTKDGSSALVAAKPRGVRGLVADHVKVQPGYEAAIAAALGSLADAVLADDDRRRHHRRHPAPRRERVEAKRVEVLLAHDVVRVHAGPRDHDARPLAVRARHRRGAALAVDHRDVGRRAEPRREVALVEAGLPEARTEVGRAGRLHLLHDLHEALGPHVALAAEEREGMRDQDAAGVGRRVGQHLASVVGDPQRLALDRGVPREVLPGEHPATLLEPGLDPAGDRPGGERLGALRPEPLERVGEIGPDEAVPRAQHTAVRGE